MGRITGEKADINYDQVADFFEHRGEGKILGNRYNYVLFQDDNPELALKRHQQETEKISKKLDVRKGQRVLDIGCGVGRWGEYLLEKGCHYVGIDGSHKMISLAMENLKEYPDKNLRTAFFQDLMDALEKMGETEPYDYIFVCGVFMYLNEDDFKTALKNVHRLCGEHVFLYFKESMAKEERLTLNGIYSDSLTQTYSAIYRSVEEYREYFMEEFGGDFHVVVDEPLFDEGLTNQKETYDYYFLFRR